MGVPGGSVRHEEAAVLSIGEFARATGLTHKALRLYDELGLLRPAHVDAASGRRSYEPGQLEHARLVAWLRRVGMPLARIRDVCAPADATATGAHLDADAAERRAAVDAVAAWWRGVEAEHSARRELVAVLVDHLARAARPTRSEDVPMTVPSLSVRYAVRTHRGLVRESNQDAAHAGARVLAVADGFGRDGVSDRAIAAIRALDHRPLDESAPAGAVLAMLRDAADAAADAVRESAGADAGTTLTAMLLSGSRLALVHVGDSRAYVLRRGELFRVTHDHTLVQSLVDDGKLTESEVASHPQRSILLRALTGRRHAADTTAATTADSTADATAATTAGTTVDPTAAPTVDAELRDAEPGDRYLLCSDGLHTVVEPDVVRDVLATAADPDDAVDRLVELALGRGAPDNVACVVADVTAPDTSPDTGPDTGRDGNQDVSAY